VYRQDTTVNKGLKSIAKMYEGKRQYELSNHLGNVLTVISDRRTYTISGTTKIYDAVVLSAQDYYPFGASIDARSFSSTTSYRYSFNGKESDKEIGTQDYGQRIYDPRLGRFLSVDPIAKKYAMLTPYQFASNRPISGVDLDGLEYADATGRQYGHLTGERIKALQDAGITIHATTLVQVDNGYIYHATQNINHYMVRVTTAGNWSDSFRPEDNDSKPISYKFQDYELEYKYDYDCEGRWGKQEAFQFVAGGRTDRDGAGGSSDASGKGQDETTYGGPTINALTDRYVALPDIMFTDTKGHDTRYGVSGGDISILRYNGIQSVAPALDKTKQKLGEHSDAVNSIDFHVPTANGNAGIDTRSVRATVFRGTTAGSAQTGVDDNGRPTGTRPSVYTQSVSQELFKNLEQAIENVREQ
jgi:RHS repeat-associated protein